MSAYKPTADQVASIIDLSSLLDYVGMSGVPPQRAAPTPQEVEKGEGKGSASAEEPAAPLMSQKQAFLALLELEPMHFRLLASVSSEAFDAAHDIWRPNGSPPSVGLRAMATVAVQTARCLCNMGAWPGEQPASAQTQTLALPAASTPASGVSSANEAPRFKTEEVIDQRLQEAITYMPDKKFQESLARYIQKMDEEPKEGACSPLHRYRPWTIFCRQIVLRTPTLACSDHMVFA